MAGVVCGHRFKVVLSVVTLHLWGPKSKLRSEVLAPPRYFKNFCTCLLLILLPASKHASSKVQELGHMYSVSRLLQHIYCAASVADVMACDAMEMVML
jgi:hypothetical protein